MKTRIYKYALSPTDLQKTQLEKCGRVTRFLWNSLVRTQKWAFREIQNGRRANIENDYLNLLAQKDLVGMRAKAVNDLANKENLSREDALQRFVKAKCQKDMQIKRRKKDDTRLLYWSARHFSWKYAVEKINSRRDTIIAPDMLPLWTGIQRKWVNFGESLDKGIFKNPRFKKFGQISAIQKQVTLTSGWKFGDYVDLCWCGSPCLGQVKVIVHREIPEGSKIKQIALIKNNVGRWFICLFLEGEDHIFQRDFKKNRSECRTRPGN